MSWARAINNAFTQIFLTISIFVIAIFVLGFVADPILNLYLDPYDTITSGVGLRDDVLLPVKGGSKSWVEHFIKGLASLGLVGFAKFFFALTPWQWWNLRTSGILNTNARVGNTGRDRMANISWIVVVLGVMTFLWVKLIEFLSLSCVLTTNRLYTKGSELGAEGRSKKLLNELWMSHWRTARKKMTRASGKTHQAILLRSHMPPRYVDQVARILL